MQTGKFININIPFSVDNEKISAKTQAEGIFQTIQDLKAKGSKGVALTYSANYGQTRDLQKTYMANNYCAKIMGSNQAQVVFEIERMLGGVQAEHQNYLQIAPITTMNAYSDPILNWNNDVLFGIVQADLDRVENYLKIGWDILGWQNQDTVGIEHSPYAIGGGIAKLPQFIHQFIQSKLIELEKKYKG